MLAFDPANVLMDLEAETREQAIEALVNAMVESGYVTPDYLQNVLERESKYPTGLPTQGVQVAIPHGMNAEGIRKPGVGVARLKSPVQFCNMADHQQTLAVELVFLLANDNADEQLKDLRRLMSCFSDEELLLSLTKAAGAKDLLRLLVEYQPEE